MHTGFRSSTVGPRGFCPSWFSSFSLSWRDRAAERPLNRRRFERREHDTSCGHQTPWTTNEDLPHRIRPGREEARDGFFGRSVVGENGRDQWCLNLPVSETPVLTHAMASYLWKSLMERLGLIKKNSVTLPSRSDESAFLSTNGRSGSVRHWFQF